MTPARQVRAVFDDDTITVYQAYSAAIAVPAATNNSFDGTPFKLDRMTGIKPSFLWMMYRSGWATKPGQEHVLAIRITRDGFEEALSQACLSHFDHDVYLNHATWEERKKVSPIRVQWDPERDLNLTPLPWRSLQVGLSARASQSFVRDWVITISDVTPLVNQLSHRASEEPRLATPLLPAERVYPLPVELRRTIGAS